MARLLGKEGWARNVEFPLRDGTLIGRDLACPICLVDDKVSRRHAQITTEGDAFAILDLGSENGLAVNGARVRRHILKPFDEIRVGDSVLVFMETPREQPPVDDDLLEKSTRVSMSDEPVLIGSSPALRAVHALIDRAAPTEAPVLITGETGTGKGLVARLIHDRGSRRVEPFVTVNCAALSSTLIESELFGHDAGAYTGATHERVGRFELARGGTVFLDEIAELDSALQAKLLRVLESGEFERVGASQTRRSSARVMAATNQDPRTSLRPDLFHRLSVLHIHLPPLRERTEDIPDLALHFSRTLARLLPYSVSGLSAEGLERLRHYAWPGNVRELRNVLERAFILAAGRSVEPHDLPAPGEFRLEPLAEIERRHIAQTLQSTGDNISRAAELLGIDRKTLYRRMKKYGL